MSDALIGVLVAVAVAAVFLARSIEATGKWGVQVNQVDVNTIEPVNR